MRHTRLALILALTLVLAACSNSKDPDGNTSSTTQAPSTADFNADDVAAARAIVPVVEDFGSGWDGPDGPGEVTAGEPGADPEFDECAGSALSDLVPGRVPEIPFGQFNDTETNTVYGSVVIYPDVAGPTKVVEAFASKRAAGCMKSAIEAGTDDEPGVSQNVNIEAFTLPKPDGAGSIAALRMAISVEYEGQRTTTSVDFVLMQTGRALTSITFTSATEGQEFNPEVRDRVLDAIASRATEQPSLQRS